MTHNDSFVTYPCVRAMLLLFNIVFWFCGLTIVWGGIWLHSDLQNYLKISTGYSTAAPLVLITIGTVIILVATLACTCIVKVQQMLLVIYGSFLIIVLFTVITLSAYIYTYRDHLLNGLSEGIRNDISNYNNPPNNHTKTIDFVQRNLQCCGSEGTKDWLQSPKKRIPDSCCTMSKCNRSKQNNIYETGCILKLQNLMNANLSFIGASASAVALLPLFGTMLTFCLATTSRKYGYEPII